MSHRIILLAALPFLAAATVFGQGALTPPGAPAPMMKTLDQIEARTPLGIPGQVSSDTITISDPGSYVLMGPITVKSGSAVQVTCSDVTIDLNGFAITSMNSVASGYGIAVIGEQSNITIRNGHIRGQATYVDNTYGGGGFTNGIYAYESRNVLVEDVAVSNIPGIGIYASIYTGSSTVRNCKASIISITGIQAAFVDGCTAHTCGSDAIVAALANNCQGMCTVPGSVDAGKGINAINATNCIGTSYGGIGIYCSEDAVGCQANSMLATGLLCTNARNSTGVSSYGIGLRAYSLAIGCQGRSESATGLQAIAASGCTAQTIGGIQALNTQVAENCQAEGGTTYGIYAYTATNCHASTSAASATAMFAAYSATNCNGTNANGTGVEAQSLTGCRGMTSNGFAAVSGRSVTNCMGLSTGSGYGIYADTANTCHATSISGIALQTKTATNCHATSTSGYAISARTATGCYGQSTSGGAAIYAAYMAAYCVGNRPDGYAIDTSIAVACWPEAGTIYAGSSKQLGTP